MKSFFNSIIERITRNLPCRMALGRLGIKLMKLGRFLQVRYANWNSEFRLSVEFYPNPDCCSVHVSEIITEETILTFDSPSRQWEKQIPLVVELFQIKGVRRVTVEPYEVSIEKGCVFSWDELLPRIEEVLLKHLIAKA